MRIPQPEPDLEAPRNDFALALQLLNKVLDNPPEDVTPAELDIICNRRARQMFEAARKLHDAVVGRRTR